MSVFYYHTLSLFGADQDLETAVSFFRQARIAYQETDTQKLHLIGDVRFDLVMYNIEVHPIGYYPKITYKTKWMPNTEDIFFMSECLDLVIEHDYNADKHDLKHKHIYTPGKCEQFAGLDRTDMESITFDDSIDCFICQNETFDTVRLATDFILYQKIRKQILESP